MEILAFLLETVTLRTKQLASQIKVLRIYVGKSFGGEDGKEMWDLGGESGAFSPPPPPPPPHHTQAQSKHIYTSIHQCLLAGLLSLHHNYNYNLGILFGGDTCVFEEEASPFPRWLNPADKET